MVSEQSNPINPDRLTPSAGGQSNQSLTLNNVITPPPGHSLLLVEPETDATSQAFGEILTEEEPGLFSEVT